MKRGASKKTEERRKKPRSKPASSRSASSRTAAKAPAKASQARVAGNRSERRARTARNEAKNEEHCRQCARDLSGTDRALFVEEEIGRIFCSEACIAGYFAPEIERLEKEFVRRLSPSDLTPDERVSLAHLRWITLQEPDEVWREKTLSGDYRYTMISEFEPGNQRVWSICICLFLRGEPSFLYIAFPTKNAAMANAYRKGEPVQWEKPRTAGNAKARRQINEGPIDGRSAEVIVDEETGGEADGELLGDRLANAWTEDETFLAQMNQERSADDIQPEEFELFQSCLEETLENPDEVWSVKLSDPPGARLYHFIRHYGEENPGHWYVIVARETDDEEDQIEILDAFPTRDSALIDRYRRGTPEVGEGNQVERNTSRVVH